MCLFFNWTISDIQPCVSLRCTVLAWYIDMLQHDYHGSISWHLYHIHIIVISFLSSEQLRSSFLATLRFIILLSLITVLFIRFPGTCLSYQYKFMFIFIITDSQLCPPFLLSWKCHRRADSANAHPLPDLWHFPSQHNPMFPTALRADSSHHARPPGLHALAAATASPCQATVSLLPFVFQPCLSLKHPVFIWVFFPSIWGASPLPISSLGLP